jgi:UDP-N-acetylmuramoyl-L-alanyl-D-glutamate--2,6-diaminopimelate ligase
LNLEELIRTLPGAEVCGNRDIEIESLAYDSRKVRKNGLFVAISGHKTDGHRYIDQAIQNGARVIVQEQGAAKVPATLTGIRVGNSREALSKLSTRFFECPARRLHLVGITGTNGKTTTSYLIESVLKAAGCRVGVLGTISYRTGSRVIPAPVTTPESLDLQELLAEMVREKITHVVMEVSSHALDQGRLGEVCFEQGIFTNLSQDHLDYHRDMEDYFQAKAKLFQHHLKPSSDGSPAQAIINRDDPYGQRLWEEIKDRKQDFRIEGRAAYFPLRLHSDLNGISGTIRTPEGDYGLTSSLIGRYNMYNILAAWAVGEGFHLPGKVIQEGIESLARVPGRMEPVPNTRGLTLLVDYAHTPQALEFALISLKASGKGRILTVFGCGGDRDPQKRPLMGLVAGTLSHFTLITSDNPRSEDPLTIIQEIKTGLIKSGRPFFERAGLNRLPDTPGYSLVPDRAEAIHLAIRLARPGDLVLIAGKGHEVHQLVGQKTLAFDDRREALKALEELDV